MKYLFDIGNTRVKWALSDGKQIHDRGVISAGGILDFFKGDHPEVDEVSIAEVSGGHIAQEVSDWAQKAFGVQAVLAKVEKQFSGVEVAYSHVGNLGVDRWLAMLGAWARVGGACIVIDAGTALKVDYIDGSGCHMGGFIVPGIDMMRRALFDGTHAVKVPELKVDPEWTPGKDTLPCVEGGVGAMLVGFVREALRAEKVFGPDVMPVLLLAGGDVEVVTRIIHHLENEKPVKASPLKRIEVCSDLVFEGLMCVS